MGISHNSYELVPEQKATVCKRCGEAGLAWVKTVNDKWILCPTTHRRPFAGWNDSEGDPRAPKGYVFAVKMRPHRCGEKEARQAAADECGRLATENMRYQHAMSDPAMYLISVAARLGTSDIEAVRLLLDLYKTFGA